MKARVIEEHTVTSIAKPIRFSDYAVGKFVHLPSRKSVKKAIKSGILQIDGEATNTGRWMSSGMQITLVESEGKKKAFELKIPVIYEDDYLAIVNKPAGLPTNGNTFRTLEHTLPFNLTQSLQSDAFKYPRPVHRLDRATSGLVLVAKTKKVQAQLGQMLEKKAIKKIYQAVVKGYPEIDENKIESPVDGKKGLTFYKVLIKNYRYLLLELKPATGRTHQLRIHCAQAGFPIVGDKLYGQNNRGPGKGLFLCATGLAFEHPVIKDQIELKIELPKKFDRLMHTVLPSDL